jgi:hypothetical protein
MPKIVSVKTLIEFLFGDSENVVFFPFDIVTIFPNLSNFIIPDFLAD